MSSSNSNPQSVYFVGVGGIGMSALARYFNARGASVFGYDLNETPLTQTLEKEGVEVHYEDRPDLLPSEIDLAIYTPAVPDTFGELIELRSRGVQLIKRAEALGIISQNHKTLAIAGTHGKTTTSAMAAYLMRELGADPVAFLGGITANYKTNYLPGNGEWLVVEADEYDRSFLHLNPSAAVITFIEPDHLDIYGELSAFEDSFHQFVRNLSGDKPTVVTKPEIKESLQRSLAEVEVISYGVDRDNVDWSASNIQVEAGQYVFDLSYPGGRLTSLNLQMPGRHNVENAVAALAIASVAGLDIRKSAQALSGFKGVQRRFEYLGEWRGRKIISDYAHHPTEVSAAIDAVKEMYDSYRIVGIFQPHLYSRTRDFADEFALAINKLDEVVLLELYPAREIPIKGISSMTIFSNINVEKKYLAHSSEVVALMEVLDAEVFLFMGAGDIDALARSLVK